jgi:hypothetical protein
VENIVAVGWLALGSSSKTADLRYRRDEAHCRLRFFLSLKMLLYPPYEMPSVLAAPANITHSTDVTIVRTFAQFISVS